MLSLRLKSLSNKVFTNVNRQVSMKQMLLWFFFFQETKTLKYFINLLFFSLQRTVIKKTLKPFFFYCRHGSFSFLLMFLLFLITFFLQLQGIKIKIKTYY